MTRRIQWLAFFPMPHEMIDDTLEPSGEEVEQRFGTVRTVKEVIFRDADHRQFAARSVKAVTRASEFFLLIEQIESCLEPFGPRNGLRIIDIAGCHGVCDLVCGL